MGEVLGTPDTAALLRRLAALRPLVEAALLLLLLLALALALPLLSRLRPRSGLSLGEPAGAVAASVGEALG